MRFLSAIPVWLANRHDEMNLTAGYRCIVDTTLPACQMALRIAMRSIYRIWIDGRFVGYGPVRSAHGHVRIDAWTWEMPPGRHLIALEAQAVNVPAFSTLNEFPFVQAEVQIEDQVVAATGVSGWQALVPGARVQSVARLSRQRGFTEAWRLQADSGDWRNRVDATFTAAVQVEVKPVVLQPRCLPLPTLVEIAPLSMTAGGTAIRGDEGPLRAWETWMRCESGGSFAGFPRSAWEIDATGEIASWASQRDPSIRPAPPQAAQHLDAGTWRIWDFSVNHPGFVRVRVVCTKASVLYLLGDEILDDQGDVDARRLEFFNGVRYELAPGTYDLINFEILTLRYLKALVISGAVTIESVGLHEYQRDLPGVAFASADPRLDRIFTAAVRTFAHNTMDNLLDCPSRERASWLCDPFFACRAEPWLTGGSLCETLFLENYSLCPALPDVPSGMLPKLYPGDQSMAMDPPTGFIANYLPTWPMWLVLQVEEYVQRGGDPAVVEAFRQRFTDLFACLDRFLNAEGLLERLEKWVFIDWSMANQHVQEVSFPANLLYAAALETAGRLYARQDWCDRAVDLRQRVKDLAWDGRFFCDNATRGLDGRLVLSGHHTEACQYYAFYFGVASPQSHPDLWRELLTRCSLAPGVTHPDLPRCGVFLGQQLRMILLARQGLHAQLVDELRAAYLPMAERTGTLWEYELPTHSCDHGFTSHVAHMLIAEVFGLTVDRRQKRMVLKIPQHDLAWCRVRLPWDGGGFIEIGWERTAAGVRPWVDRLPAGWTCELPV